MLSVSVPAAVMPQFQLLMELAQLGKHDADVAKILADNLESTIQNHDVSEKEMSRELRRALNPSTTSREKTLSRSR